jgi:hypothetical protein
VTTTVGAAAAPAGQADPPGAARREQTSARRNVDYHPVATDGAAHAAALIAGLL